MKKVYKGQLALRVKELEAELVRLKGNWSDDLPTAPGVYWWWNGDPNGEPIDVRLDTAGCPHGNLYALPGQHDWNWLQPVTEMGGYWAACAAPQLPHELRMKHAGGAEV